MVARRHKRVIYTLLGWPTSVPNEGLTDHFHYELAIEKDSRAPEVYFKDV